MTDTRLKPGFASLLMAIVFLTAVGLIAPKAGFASDFYQVRGISVDKTAASATDARTLAVAEGQRRAFAVLFRKLTPKSYHPDVPSLSDSELTSMVAGFQVAGEKSAPGRYIANLTFEFRKELVLPILQANDIPYSESVSKPILVLPIFDNDGVKNLWNEPNPWRDAWQEVFDGGQGPEGSQKRQDDWAQKPVVPILVPAGSLGDMQVITVDQAVFLEETSIQNIQEEYGAGAVLVAYASLQNRGGVRRLDISYQRSDFLSAAVVESFTGGDDDRDIYRAAIFDVMSNLQEGWKDQNILDRSIQNRLAVSSKITGLQDWLKIKEKASSIPAVEEIKVRELSVSNVFWEISFVGDLIQLRSALAQRELNLQNEDGYWTLDTNPAQ